MIALWCVHMAWEFPNDDHDNFNDGSYLPQCSPNQLTSNKSSFILRESTDVNSSICCCINKCDHPSTILHKFPTSNFYKTKATTIIDLLNDNDDNLLNKNEQEDMALPSTFLQEWDAFYNEFKNSTTYAPIHSSTLTLCPLPLSTLMTTKIKWWMTTNWPPASMPPSASCTILSGSWKKLATNLQHFLSLLIPKPLASQPSHSLPSCSNPNHAPNPSMTVHCCMSLHRYCLLHPTLQPAPYCTRPNQHLRLIATVPYLGQCPLSTTLHQQPYPVNSLNLQLQRQQFPTGPNQPYHLLPPIWWQARFAWGKPTGPHHDRKGRHSHSRKKQWPNPLLQPTRTPSTCPS